MAGEWECSICGYTNDASDKWCIQCYQDRADAELNPVKQLPWWWPKAAKKKDDEEEDDDDN